jgi:hypothetical protein
MFQFGGKIVPLSILNLLFKTKGPTHSVVQQKHCVQLTPEVATTVEQFADMFVTKNRLEQALQETRGYALTDSSGPGGSERQHSKSSRHQWRGGKGKEIAKVQSTAVGEGVSETTKLSRQLPYFIKWIVNDVKREGQDELVASNLKWEEVVVAIEVAGRRWFQAEVLHRCGTASSASFSASTSFASSSSSSEGVS